MQDKLGNTVENDEVHMRSEVTINDLPVEIILNIFSNLEPVDLKDLRLVCQKWNHVVSDKRAWTSAFRNRLGTGKVFASVTRSNHWLPEYFGRVSATRKWKKAKGTAQLYQIFNSEFGTVGHVEADFVHDRLLVFDGTFGAVSLCTLTLGKNQVYIPDNRLFAHNLAYDVSWNYLCWGNEHGTIFLKNLATATSSAALILSTTQFGNCDSPLVFLRLNRDADKHRGKVDIVSVTQSGLMQFWTLGGTAKGSTEVFSEGEEFISAEVDFNNMVVVVTLKSIVIVDFSTFQVTTQYDYRNFCEVPLDVKVDFGDNNVVFCGSHAVHIIHFGAEVLILVGHAPDQIIAATLQKISAPRNKDIAGGDGRLCAITLVDASVCVFNIRDVGNTFTFNTRITPFSDSRAPEVVAHLIKVAINSSVIAIGALADWIHFYDAHSGEYLREGTKVSRRLTRNGTLPILTLEFGPTDACGVVVSGDVVQYFRFGDVTGTRKKPNAPAGSDLLSRREMHRHIRAQMDEYDAQEHVRRERERMFDKYNGTNYDSEMEELRMAMALSESYTDPDLERAILLLKEPSVAEDMDPDLQRALALSEQETTLDGSGSSKMREWELLSATASQSFEHGQTLQDSTTLGNTNTDKETTGYDSDEEMLRRVLELLLVDH